MGLWTLCSSFVPSPKTQVQRPKTKEPRTNSNELQPLQQRTIRLGSDGTARGPDGASVRREDRYPVGDYIAVGAPLAGIAHDLQYLPHHPPSSHNRPGAGDVGRADSGGGVDHPKQGRRAGRMGPLHPGRTVALAADVPEAGALLRERRFRLPGLRKGLRAGPRRADPPPQAETAASGHYGNHHPAGRRVRWIQAARGLARDGECGL